MRIVQKKDGEIWIYEEDLTVVSCIVDKLLEATPSGLIYGIKDTPAHDYIRFRPGCSAEKYDAACEALEAELSLVWLEEDWIVCGRVGVANLYRRVLMTRIPTYAIDEITVHSSAEDSPDHPVEIVAHQLGQVPIVMGREPVDERELTGFIASTGETIRTSDVVFHGPFGAAASYDVCRNPGLSFNATFKLKLGAARDHAKHAACSNPEYKPVRVLPFELAEELRSHGVAVDVDGTLPPSVKKERVMEILGEAYKEARVERWRVKISPVGQYSAREIFDHCRRIVDRDLGVLRSTVKCLLHDLEGHA